MAASFGLTRPLCGKEGTCVCVCVDEDAWICVCGPNATSGAVPRVLSTLRQGVLLAWDSPIRLG